MQTHPLNEKAQEAFKYIESLWYCPIYIGLYGSQNYWLDIYDDDYTSDVDWKCIILPTLDDLISNSKPVSTVIQFEWWQIDLKDIRSFVDSVVKCNVNFLEILTTEYYYSRYEEFPLRKYVAWLMKEMWQLYLKACFGMMREKEKALRHPYPTTLTRLEKFWYDPKQFHHIARLHILMQRYIDCANKDFIWNIASFYHFWWEKEMLINIKKGEIRNEDVDKQVELLMLSAFKLRNSYTTPMEFTTKEEMIKSAQDLIRNEIIWAIHSTKQWKTSETPPSQSDSVNAAETQ